MIVKSELVNRIREYFDLNIYETKAWLALLSKGIATAGEIAIISGVPRSRTYDVLESLEKRGFAVIRVGKPVKYIAVKPTEVVEKMKNNVMNIAQDKVKTLSTIRSTSEYAELDALHRNGIILVRPHEITGSLRGRSNIMAKIRDIVENCEKEAFICTSSSDFENKSRALVPALETLNKKNVKVKIALSGEDEHIKKVSHKYNIKPRIAGTNARVFMADKKQALVMITPENSGEEMGVWLNSEYFISSLNNIVERAIK